MSYHEWSWDIVCIVSYGELWWVIVSHHELSWAIVSYRELLWAITDTCGNFWTLIDYCIHLLTLVDICWHFLVGRIWLPETTCPVDNPPRDNLPRDNLPTETTRPWWQLTLRQSATMVLCSTKICCNELLYCFSSADYEHTYVALNRVSFHWWVSLRLLF